MRGWNIGGVVWLLMTILALIVPPSAGAQSASSDQYYAAGVQMYNAHNYSQAIQYFNAAIKLNSYNAMAYQAAGNCYYALGNKQYALAYYQRDLALQPTNTQLAQLVQTLQAQINGGGMSQPGMGMTAQNPLNQGYALLQQRQYAAAIPYLQQAAQQNPADYRAFYLRVMLTPVRGIPRMGPSTLKWQLPKVEMLPLRPMPIGSRVPSAPMINNGWMIKRPNI